MGAYISMFLVGITTLQAWNYFRAFSGDHVAVRTMAGVIYGADLFHSIILVHIVYHYTSVGFSCAESYCTTGLVWSLQCALIVGGIIMMIVQCYFALRVLKIKERPASLGIPLWILAIVRLGLTINVTVTARRDGTVEILYSSSIKSQYALAVTIGACTDVFIAMALCADVLRRRPGFNRSDSLIDRLVAFTIGSGLLTGIITFIQMVTYLAMTGNLIWTVFFSIGVKMSSNSLLSSLNQRRRENSDEGVQPASGSSISSNTLVTQGNKGSNATSV